LIAAVPRRENGMTIRVVMISMAAVGLCACHQPIENPAETNAITATTVNETMAAPPPSADNAEANVNLPDDRTPLEEPKGPIDPKSAEGAGQVVQHYGALIEQGRWAESWKLWSSADAAKAFDRNWRNASEVHLEIGKPSDSEGAAGSIYITDPVVFYGKAKAGGSFRRAATVTLRRVNDVPGSTEAQRRWHIERIEWKAAA
jgi:hypothetical protein